MARRAGLRRRARPDDLGQLPRRCRTPSTSSACRASAGPGPTSSRRSTASPSPTATSRPRASCAPTGCKQQGHEKVGLFWEQGSSGKDYADYFRDTALQPRPDDHPRGEARAQPASACRTTWPTMRDLGAEGIYYGGYGYATFHFADAFKALDWDPPRVMGTAFMFYSNSQRVGRGPRGLARRRPARRGRRQPELQRDDRALREALRPRQPRNVVVALAYDTARVAIHGIGNAAIPDAPLGEGGHGAHPLDAGHQRRARHATSSSVPTTARATRATSSPSASCAAASSRFDGYHRPEWPSNATVPS